MEVLSLLGADATGKIAESKDATDSETSDKGVKTLTGLELLIEVEKGRYNGDSLEE